MNAAGYAALAARGFHFGGRGFGGGHGLPRFLLHLFIWHAIGRLLWGRPVISLPIILLIVGLVGYIVWRRRRA